MIIDRLYENVCKKGNVCIGLDTSMDYIPSSFKMKYSSIEDTLFEFNKRIIDAAYDTAACFKVQIAYYEAYGIEGLSAYRKTLKYLRDNGIIIIADIKRGDISATADMYAKAHFTGDFEADFITLNPYMGFDSITPYLKYVENDEKGLFILIRTSNEGAKDIQYIEAKNGEKIYKSVADGIYKISEKFKGKCGYSSIGGVAGCTNTDEAAEFRESYKNMFFLIPGYGAQGGSAKDAAIFLKKGNGGIVNASRSILLAYKKYEGRENEFDVCAREKAIEMKEEIKNAVKLLG
jgi:orotidine-5'-phosphate decarboxylase